METIGAFCLKFSPCAIPPAREWKPCWQKPCCQIHAHGLHGYVSASARVAPLRKYSYFSWWYSLKLSGKLPVGLGIQPLKTKILLGSNPLKSRILLRRLAVHAAGRPGTGGGLAILTVLRLASVLRRVGRRVARVREHARAWRGLDFRRLKVCCRPRCAMAGVSFSMLSLR